MNDPSLNNLLRWGIENSEASQNGDAPAPPKTHIDPSALQALLGAAPPSDAEMMKRCMQIITEPDASLDDKIAAFEDFEMLIQSLDNANNMESLKLWGKLLEQLEHDEAELRKYAAWCAGTAVENNAKAQERLLVHGAIPTLVKLATEDENVDVRKKAARALSCASRNFQPGLDAVVDHVPPHLKPKEKLDAADMSSVDSLIHPIRADAARPR